MKRIVLWLAAGLFALVSLRPLAFTWTLLRVHHSRGRDDGHAAYLLLKAVSLNPSMAADMPIVAGMDRNALLEGVLRRMILSGETGLMRDLASIGFSSAFLDEKFKDNMYYRYRRGTIDGRGEWRHLDPLSLALLGEERANPLTLSILDTLSGRLPGDFLTDLYRFAAWQKNDGLVRGLESRHPARLEIVNRPILAGIAADRSMDMTARMLGWTAAQADELRSGALFKEDFAESSSLFERWFFSDMSDVSPYGPASFHAGTVADGGCRGVRIMGFFVRKEKGRADPRGGIWLRSPLTLPPGNHLFSLDYCTETGRERPSVWLRDGLEVFLPVTGGRWAKAVFLLPEADAAASSIRPLVRIWGTGSLRIDNIAVWPDRGTTPRVAPSLDPMLEFYEP